MTHRSAFPLGRDMWKKELSDHQRRLHSVRPTLPAPTAPSSARPVTHSGRQQLTTTTQRLGSPPSGAANGQQGLSPAAGAAAKGLRIEQLRPEDQSTCHAMVAVLQSLSTSDCKSILEELFVGCEMKRLLSQYTGVYPTDGAADGPIAGSNSATNTVPLVRTVPPTAARTPPEPRSSSPTVGSLNASVSSVKGPSKYQHHSPSAAAAAKRKEAVDTSTKSSRNSAPKRQPPLAPQKPAHAQPPPPAATTAEAPLGQSEDTADVGSERNASDNYEGNDDNFQATLSSNASKPGEGPVADVNDASVGDTPPPPVPADSVEDDAIVEEATAPVPPVSAGPQPPQPPSERRSPSRDAEEDYGDESFDQ